jgi:hypothetical protein
LPDEDTTGTRTAAPDLAVPPMRDPWPCRRARADLLADHADDLVFLAVFMATTMSEAVHDLYALNPDATPTPAEIWDRFMQWLDGARRGST